MRLSKTDSTPPYRLQLNKAVVRSLGHLRITAHIRRQFAWSVRDSWVSWDRLESVGISRQNFNDLKFSEIVYRFCTFSYQFHHAVQVVIELHWVEFGWSAKQRSTDLHWPPPLNWLRPSTNFARLPPTVWIDWILLRPTELSWVQFFATDLDQYQTSLFEASWVGVDRSM